MWHIQEIVTLIKTRLSEIYSKSVQKKSVLCEFIQNSMNQGNFLSQLLFDSALLYAITKVQEKYKGLNVFGTVWSRMNSFYCEGTNKHTTTTTTTITIIIIYLSSASPFELIHMYAYFFIELFILDSVQIYA
jgi:hypothetical protein